MYRSVILYIVILLSCSSVYSQQKTNFYTRNFTTENGLPSNGIKGLQWDEQTGFLWIATEAGVSRFNGLSFKNYAQENTPTITAERMTFMVRNKAGKIYTSDQAGNLHFVNKNKLEFFDMITAPKQGNTDFRFAISVSDFFYRSSKKFNSPGTIVFIANRVLPISDSSCFIYSGGKIYWSSSRIGNVVPYSEKELIVKDYFKIGNKFFFTDSKLDFYQMFETSPKSEVVPFFSNEISKSEILNKSSRLFWVNGMEYPVVINQHKAWKLFFTGTGISAKLICDNVPTDAFIEYVQYSEKMRSLFLGTNSKGITIISENVVDVMKNIHALPHQRNAYYAQVELPDGNILTNEGHVVGNNLSSSLSLPIKTKFAGFVSTTGDSIIWYSRGNQSNGEGRKYLHSYNKKTGTTKIYTKIPGGENIVYEMKNGKIFITSELGIGELINDSVHYFYHTPVQNYSTAIYGITEVKPGIILAATCSGIFQIDVARQKTDTILKTDGYCIRSIWKYNDYVFFGSYGKGFLVWKNGKLKNMPLDKKKYLLYAHCFIPDGQGYCWISTNRGLFKAAISELINAYEKDNATLYYHYFGKKDGMDMIEMNGGCTPCAIQLKNKTLSFPTMDGLLWADPINAKPILPDGDIFIDEIIAGNKIVTADKSGNIRLPSTTKEISVQLSFGAWCNYENIYLEYQLNDTLNWKPVNTDNESIIHFNNLPSGDYVLRFRKLNGFGVNNYSYSTINFTITTPWHKTIWFNLLMMAVIIGLVLLYVQSRTGQLKRQQLRLQKMVNEKTKELQEQNEMLEKNNSIKTRLISIISHDIVTPLKFLTVAGKNLLKQREIMPEELQQETIKEMTNTSQELQLLSTNILNWIKYQNENRRLTKETFNIYEMVNQVLGILNSLAQQKNLRIVNEIDKEATIYQYYEPMKILVYNMLTNAIHFSEKGTITVRAKNTDGNTIVSVQDEGVGMTPEKKQSLMEDHVVISSANVDNRKGHGLGFLIIKDLLKMMEATIDIESTVGKGTTISIIIPV